MHDLSPQQEELLNKFVNTLAALFYNEPGYLIKTMSRFLFTPTNESIAKRSPYLACRADDGVSLRLIDVALEAASSSPAQKKEIAAFALDVFIIFLKNECNKQQIKAPSVDRVSFENIIIKDPMKFDQWIAPWESLVDTMSDFFTLRSRKHFNSMAYFAEAIQNSIDIIRYPNISAPSIDPTSELKEILRNYFIKLNESSMEVNAKETVNLIHEYCKTILLHFHLTYEDEAKKAKKNSQRYKQCKKISYSCLNLCITLFDDMVAELDLLSQLHLAKTNALENIYPESNVKKVNKFSKTVSFNTQEIKSAKDDSLTLNCNSTQNSDLSFDTRQLPAMTKIDRSHGSFTRSIFSQELVSYDTTLSSEWTNRKNRWYADDSMRVKDWRHMLQTSKDISSEIVYLKHYGFHKNSHAKINKKSRKIPGELNDQYLGNSEVIIIQHKY